MDRYEASLEALRNAGYRVTGPRLTILQALTQLDGHCTSCQLLDLVQQLDSTIGRASVFRTLHLMRKLGIVWTSAQGTSTIHHILMRGGHHHHFVCTNCHKLIEFEECRLGRLILSLEQQYGAHIEGHLMEVFGLC